jgi:hypothetical protein
MRAKISSFSRQSIFKLKAFEGNRRNVSDRLCQNVHTDQITLYVCFAVERFVAHSDGAHQKSLTGVQFKFDLGVCS